MSILKKRGRKPEDNDMTLQEWVNEYMDFVDKMVGQGHNPLNLGQYSTLSRSNAVCLKSLVGMASLLFMKLGRVPCAVLNSTMLQRVLEVVGAKRPGIVKSSKSLGDWAELLAKQLRIALAHLRQVALRRKAYEIKMRLLVDMQRAKLLEILAKVDVGGALASVADSLGKDSQEPEQSPKKTQGKDF
jgi:hypothetical protein